jgi:hypothetical protein
LRGFARLCAAPCDITLPAGTETFGVGEEDERFYKMESITFGPGHSEIRASYRNNQWKRNIGWLTMAGGLLGGAGIIALGAHENSKPLKAVGWLTALGGIGVGIAFVFISDDATITQVPGSTPPPQGERKASLAVGLRGTF